MTTPDSTFKSVNEPLQWHDFSSSRVQACMLLSAELCLKNYRHIATPPSPHPPPTRAPTPHPNPPLQVWNPRSGACLRTMESGYGLSALFAPGNRHAVVGTKEGTIEIFDVGTSSRVAVVE